MPDLTLEEMLARLDGELRAMKNPGGSRYIGAGADPDVAAHVAAGGSVKRGSGTPHERRLGLGDEVGGRRPTDRRARSRRKGSGSRWPRRSWPSATIGRTGLTPVWADKALAEATDARADTCWSPRSLRT